MGGKMMPVVCGNGVVLAQDVLFQPQEPGLFPVDPRGARVVMVAVIVRLAFDAGLAIGTTAVRAHQITSSSFRRSSSPPLTISP